MELVGAVVLCAVFFAAAWFIFLRPPVGDSGDTLGEEEGVRPVGEVNGEAHSRRN
jgi:hypothetical protein